MYDWARQWQATDKVVYSRTLADPSSGRTRIEREFDAGAVRRLKSESDRDLTVAGPELAAQAIEAGLVDEYQLLVSPVVVGGGKRFFPDGVRLDLELTDERRFGSGVAFLRYSARNRPATGVEYGVSAPSQGGDAATVPHRTQEVQRGDPADGQRSHRRRRS